MSTWPLNKTSAEQCTAWVTADVDDLDSDDRCGAVDPPVDLYADGVTYPEHACGRDAIYLAGLTEYGKTSPGWTVLCDQHAAAARGWERLTLLTTLPTLPTSTP